MKPWFCLLLLTLPGLATEPQPIALDEVVITATRLPLSLRDTGSVAYVFTREEIESVHARDLQQLLETVPALQLTRTGAAGSATGLRLRGSADNHVLLLVDGVEQNDPSTPGRSLDLSTVDLGTVERVEIVMGPQSALYGTDAIGGVVQVFTRRPQQGELSLQLAGGSHAQQQADLRLGGGLGPLGLALDLGHQAAAGESAVPQGDDDGYWRRSVGLQAVLEGDGRGLTAGLSYQAGETELDNFGGPGGDDPDYVGRLRDLQLRLDLHQAGPAA